MRKFFVLHNGNDSYIDADDSTLSPGGDLCFILNDKLTACFSRDQWEFMKEVEIEKV